MRSKQKQPVHYWPSARRAITLVELLVVIVILTTITAAAIPVAIPAIAKRQLREAARGVDTYISGARYRAQEIGRPVGVLFERIPNEPRAVRTLRYVEIPPPYAGYFSSSTLLMTKEFPLDPSSLAFIVTLDANDPIPQRLLRPGDRLRVDYQGSYYQLDSGGDNTTYVDGYIATENTNLPTQLRVQLIYDGGIPPGVSNGPPSPLPYQIFRQPEATAVAPYQLPEGTVIDLVGSGPGQSGTFDPQVTNNNTILMLTFNPDGTVHRLYSDAFGPLVGLPTIDTLAFLVGKREFVIEPTAASQDDLNKANWLQPNSQWVVVRSSTGNIATAENGAVPEGGVAITAGSIHTQINIARRFAFTTQPESGG